MSQTMTFPVFTVCAVLAIAIAIFFTVAHILHIAVSVVGAPGAIAVAAIVVAVTSIILARRVVAAATARRRRGATTGRALTAGRTLAVTARLEAPRR